MKVIFLLAFLSLITHIQGQGTLVHFVFSKGSPTSVENTQLRASIGKEGHLFSGRQGFRIPYQYTVAGPKAQEAAGVWLGGQTNTGVAVSIQRSEPENDGFAPGPLDNATGTPVPNATRFGRIFSAGRYEVEALLADIAVNGMVTDSGLGRLLIWPARGNPYFQSLTGFALPLQDLAPFYDANGDGVYDPFQGDYPTFKHGVANAIAEEVHWTVTHTTDGAISNGRTLGIELQQLVYVLECDTNSLLNQTVFVHQKLLNKSGQTISNFRFGTQGNLNLGNASNDQIGTDVLRNAVYAYSIDNNDPSTSQVVGYGPNGPAYSATLLSEPLNGVIAYEPGTSTPEGEPTTVAGIYNFLDSRFKDSTVITASGSGYATPGGVTQFSFNGDPVTNTGWISANVPAADFVNRQLYVANIQRAAFSSGAVLEADWAYTLHRDINRTDVQNIGYMRERIDSLQAYFDNGLENLGCGVPSYCLANCVFPGDANNNGVANDFDILEMAYQQGTVTPARAQQGRRWFPHAPAVVGPAAYLDSDGNGTVNIQDLWTNTLNFGKIQGRQGPREGDNTLGNDLRLVRSTHQPFWSTDSIVSPGDTIGFDLVLGDGSNPFTITGITCRIRYDSEIFTLNRYFGLGGFSNFLMGSQGFDYWRWSLEEGRVHFVQTRLDGTNATGSGIFTNLEFRVSPQAALPQPVMTTQFCIEDFKAIMGDGTVVPISAQCINVSYGSPSIAVQPIANAPAVGLYPNPAQTHTWVDLGNASAEQLVLHNALGQPVRQLGPTMGRFALEREELPAGVYTLVIYFENGTRGSYPLIFK